MKFTMVVKYRNDDTKPPWKEPDNDATLETKADVLAFCLNSIATFNRQRMAQYNGNYDPRELVTILFDDDDNNVKEKGFEHDWSKANAVTQFDKRGQYDAYKCNHCGITGKRRGLMDFIIERDKKFKSEKFQYCKK